MSKQALFEVLIFLESCRVEIIYKSLLELGKTEAEMPYDQRNEQALYIKVEGLMQRLFNVTGPDTKDTWILPESTIFDLPEVKGKVRYATKKKKIVRIDPTEPGGAEAYE